MKTGAATGDSGGRKPMKRGQLSATLTILLLLASAGIWWFGVQASETALERRRTELKAVQAEIAAMRALIAERPSIEARQKTAGAGNAAHAASLLEPLLGSWAMRAKTQLEPIAEACGLEGIRFTDVPETVGLPAFGNGKASYCRRRVRVEADGPYQRLISFLCKVERQFGGMLTSSVTVTGSSETPEIQRAAFAFEWLSRPDEGGGAK